jgi:hypothetical protein
MSFMGRPLLAAVTPVAPNLNTGDNFYEIETIENLYWIAQEVNAGSFSTGINVRLMTSLELNSHEDYSLVDTYVTNGLNPEQKPTLSDDFVYWVPIGTEEHPFIGEFHGNGQRISYMLPNLDEIGNEFGLIGHAQNANIHDLTIYYSVFLANNYSAPFVAVTHESVELDCNRSELPTTHVINADGFSSGMVGILSESSSLSNCSAWLMLKAGQSNFGGFVGQNSGSVRCCYLINYGGTPTLEHLICYTTTTPVSNCYYQTNTGTYSESGITPVSDEEVYSGRLCFLLNEGNPNGKWGQTPGTRGSPSATTMERDPNTNLCQQDGCIYYSKSSEDDDIYFAVNLCEKNGFNVSGSVQAQTVYLYRAYNKPLSWNTICVPFVLTESCFDSDQGYKIGLYTIKDIAEKQEHEYSINLEKVETIPANTPAFLCLRNNFWSFFEIIAEGDADNPIQIGGEAGTLTYGDFEFRGVYEAGTSFNEEQTVTGRYFFVSQDALWRGINPFSIKPFRAYLYCTKEDMGAAPMRFTLNTLDEVSAIDALEDVVPHSQPVTDLMGRPASPDAKGLLITNHKKLLVR